MKPVFFNFTYVICLVHANAFAISISCIVFVCLFKMAKVIPRLVCRMF